MSRPPKPNRSSHTPSTVTRTAVALPCPTAAEQGAIEKLLRQQKYPQLQIRAEQLTEKYPAHPFGWLILAKARSSLEQWAKALVALEKADQLAPQCPETLAALGYAHLKQNQTELAIDYLTRALTIDADQLHALIGLARAQFGKGNYEQVIHHCEHILAIDEKNVTIMTLRAAALAKLGKIQEALLVLKKILSIAPEDFAANNNIANLYLLTMQPEKSEEHYRRAWKCAPEDEAPFSNLFIAMHYNPAYQESDFLRASLEWEKNFGAISHQERTHTPKVTNRKVRVGLISGGFRTHPVGQMITSALENLPRDFFELFAYTTNDNTDIVTTRIQKTVHHWKLIEHFNHQAVADQVRQDKIDILIDLNGAGEGSCYKAIAEKPAPIQVKWVGSLINTTGLSAFDYLISDSIETPDGSDSFYCEKLIRMPDDYICYCPPEYTPPQAALPALGNGYITFGCLNNPAKLNRQLLAQWAELLHALPNSRLLLKGQQYGGEEFCDSIRAMMADYGVAADRLILEGPANHRDFLATYNRIDIALDTWPYSGGLTTCEAMLMGVPVVTMPGPTFAGRHSATHLINAGMPELVTNSWDEYRERVIELASDLPNLAVIRACLRTILLESPVCDGARFGKHLSTALRAIWQRYCEDKAPAALTLEKSGLAHFEGETQPVRIQPIAAQTNDSDAPNDEFRWDIEGKIITLDSGALITADPIFPELQKLGAFATITLDPSSKVKNAEQLQQNGELHYYPHVALGNGEEGTLYACLNPTMSGMLEPLPAEQQLPGHREGAQVLAKLPITTLRLDEIEGLESIDWLLLDNLNDSLSILENGEKTLANTLLVQARINFVPTHRQQPELTQISHWLARHGFSFYRLNNFNHYSHLPSHTDLRKQQASQLVGADALFIPSQQRMETLDSQRRAKLAFILHSAYQIHDLTFSLLHQEDTSSGKKYLESNGYLKKTDPSIKEERKARVLINSGNPKICIGIPAYNEESYIHETVASLKRQDIDGVKFILSDNASTDRTYEIAESLSRDDHRFEVIRHSKNMGAADNFISLFEESSSEYFMWLGAHDYLSDNYISDTANILDSNRSVSMACGYPFGIIDGKVFGPITEATYDFSQSNPAVRYLSSVATLANCTVFHSLFRRKDLDGFEFRKTISADHTIISRLLWKGTLQYSENSKYFRRYFPKRESTVEERILGRRGSLERKDFFDHYISDLRKLQGAQRDEKLINKVEATLKSRFK